MNTFSLCKTLEVFLVKYHFSQLKYCLLFVTLLCSTTFSLDDISIHGWGWNTWGRFIKATPYKLDTIEGTNYVNLDAGLKIKSQINQYSSVRLHLAFSMSYLLYQKRVDASMLNKRWIPSILDATYELKYPLFNTDSLNLELGYFPVKYNPQATNLGEYLFRSNTYPPVVTSGFELADKVKLLGIHLQYHQKFFGSLNHHFYSNLETEIFPLHDLSLGYILNYFTPSKVIDFGAGGQFSRFLPSNSKITTPGLDPENLGSFNGNDYIFIDYQDTIPIDTTKYSFAGIKLMYRLTFDIKPLLGLDFLGKEDFKVYGEAAILGVKNYKGWYDNITERMPRMVGINFPTLGIIDLVSIEFEYYKSPYPNEYVNIWKNRSPAPFEGRSITDTSSYEDLIQKDDDLKWSVYASHKITKNLRVSAMFASDHIKATQYLYSVAPTFKFHELVPNTKDFYFMSRIEYKF